MATISIDDELSRQACIAASETGKSLDEFVAEAVRSALQTSSNATKTYRNGIPVLHVEGRDQAIDPARIRAEIEEWSE